MTIPRAEFPKIWNPYQVYTVKRKKLQEWFELYGSSCFYNGILWKPKSESIGAGYYKIKFVKA